MKKDKSIRYYSCIVCRKLLTAIGPIKDNIHCQHKIREISKQVYKGLENG